jgi:hypothetical protein
MKIRPVRWDQGCLHNRFILTENGGLKFAIGLDDHNNSARKHDIVDLLEPEPYVKTWQEYQRVRARGMSGTREAPLRSGWIGGGCRQYGVPPW